MFGINTTVLDLPFREYLVLSLFALGRGRTIVLAAIVVPMAALFWYAVDQFSHVLDKRQIDEKSAKGWRGLRSLLIEVGIAMVAFASFVLTVSLTIGAGVSDAKGYLNSAELVHLIFKAENRKLVEQYETDLLTANDKDQLRFCFQTKDLIIVFVNSSTGSKSGRTYVIARADLALVRVGIDAQPFRAH